MPKVGEKVTADQVCGEVESTKSVSEIYAPVSGEIVAVNSELDGAPELINSDPYGAGWLVEIDVPSQPTGLLTAAQYGEITA
jgi:glycine cleavage system H protein